MLCQDIMSKDVKCISPEDTVKTAAELMRDADVGFLPVCDDNQLVQGVLTDRDITLRSVAEGYDPDATRVDEVMSGDLISCAPTDDVSLAEQKMKNAQKSRIVCADQSGKLLGVISLTDIARGDEQHMSDVFRDVKQPAASQAVHAH